MSFAGNSHYQTYVIMTAARNEIRYISQTIESVVRQTVLPQQWVIVSDGSSDGTDEIVLRFAQRHHFIRLIQVPTNGKRDFRSKVLALGMGESALAGLEYEYIANVDADISLPPNYFERVLKQFQADSALGIGGGVLVEPHAGRWIRQSSNTRWSVSGAIQVFRRKCYSEIGGYPPLELGGEDTMAEVVARMNGWRVRAFPEIVACHNKPTRGYISGLRAAYRLGGQEYMYGTHPLFQFLKCAARVMDRPWIIMSAVRMGGYLWYLAQGKRKAVPKNIVSFVRREQVRRIASPFRNWDSLP